MELACKHLVLVGFTCATLSTLFFVWQAGFKCGQTASLSPLANAAASRVEESPFEGSENRTRTRHGKGKRRKKVHHDDDHAGDDDEPSDVQPQLFNAAVVSSVSPAPAPWASAAALPEALHFASAASAPPPKEFATSPESCAMRQRMKQQLHFDRVHKTNSWGSDARVTTSGRGSDQQGAYDWVYHINMFMLQYNIRTVADLPCGDVAWQFSVPSINKAKAYFGGDISASVAKRNGEQYTSHLNKMFRHWDLIECGVPQVCLGSSCTPFDMVITRDALQHMTVFDGLKAVKNIVSSGAKYFAVSSYPPETVDKMARAAYTGSGSGLQMRAGHPGQGFRQEVSEGYIQRCQSDDALKRKYCQQGKRTEDIGWWYPNVMRCFPFNFPPPVLDKLSHDTFKIEPDHLQIFRISDLKSVVLQYDDFAEFCRSN